MKALISAAWFLTLIYLISFPNCWVEYPDKKCLDDFEIIDEYVKITVYNPVPTQTHGNHLETADGTIIDPKNLGKSVAVSRDLLDRFNMGEFIQILCNCPYQGIYIINDKLGQKARKQIDVLSHNRDGLYYGKIQKIKK